MKNSELLAGKSWLSKIVDGIPAEDSMHGEEGYVLDPLDYGVAVQAVDALGVDRSSVPSYEDVRGRITPEVRDFLGEQCLRGDAPVLTFHIPLDKRSEVQGLLANYVGLNSADRGGAVEDRVNMDMVRFSVSYMFGPADTEPDHNQGRSGVEPGFVLMDTNDPRDRSMPARRLDLEIEGYPRDELGYEPYVSPGLVYADLSAGQQRVILADEAAGLKNRGVKVDSVTLSELIVLASERHDPSLPLTRRVGNTTYVAGPEVLKSMGLTTLPNYQNVKTRDGEDAVPGIGLLPGCLDPSLQTLDEQFGGSGVMRIVRLGRGQAK